MANTSTLDLVKPAGTDYALVSTINGNMDKIDAEAAKERGNFAGTYSTSSAYAVGAYCIYQGNLYRCTTAIGSGGEAWTAGHWSQVSVGEEITSLNGKFTLSGVNITTESGVTSNLFAHKHSDSNPVVTINGFVTFTNAPTSQVHFATIAQGSRPGSPVRILCGLAPYAYDPPSAIGYLNIGTDGKMYINPPTNNTSKNAYFSVSYYAQG